MKISIYNFKTIRELEGFEIMPFNVISGVNSSGKSSFIQFLLLIKQSLEQNPNNKFLQFNDDIINLGTFESVVYKKNIETKISSSFIFDEKEIGSSFHDASYLKLEQGKIHVEFSQLHGTTLLSKVTFDYHTQVKIKPDQWISFSRKNVKGEENIFNIDTNTGIFNAPIFEAVVRKQAPLIGEVSFKAFFPLVIGVELPNPEFAPEISKNETPIFQVAIPEFIKRSIEPKITGLRKLVESFFEGISYIGPLRADPEDIYITKDSDGKIGNKGENTASLLQNEATLDIEYFKIVKHENGITYEKHKGHLIDAVKYWVCDVLELAKNIKTEKKGDEYIIKVVNHYGIENTIKHVGFGVCQVLPIVVEGLRMKENGILVLEQPEIHLHPKVQSLLFDFLFSLSYSGKRVIIETHSDHLITRMRRRIAEDKEGVSKRMVNLVFVEERQNEHVFRKLDVDDMGTLSYFPSDFIEQTDIEFRAIIKAQALKRKNKPKPNN